MSDSRAFKNSFPEWNPSLASTFPQAKITARHAAENLLHVLERQESEMDPKDMTVYTGLPGIALLYYHLHHKLPAERTPRYLEKALTFLNYGLKHLKQHRISFLCGAPGILAISAVVYKELGSDQANSCVTRLNEFLPVVLSENEGDPPDELLYGRIGFLYALLFIKSKGLEVDDKVIKQVVQTILASGCRLAKKKNSKCPLMYSWHDKYYIGAAHGMSGILYLLMELQEFMETSSLQNFIKPTVDYVLSLQFPSGNFPSSLGNDQDKLVHWCHGAPGVIHMLIKAFNVFKEEKYLIAAEKASTVIWNKGLLKKGFGICHGVSGNAYAFLHMYQATNDEKFLYWAFKFAEWCIPMERSKYKTPDRPLSLFEGLAGMIYFLADLEDPLQAKFPAFQL